MELNNSVWIGCMLVSKRWELAAQRTEWSNCVQWNHEEPPASMKSRSRSIRAPRGTRRWPMFTDKLTRRIAWPTILVAVVLLAASATAAVILQREQARTAAVLREDVSSRTVAQNLETVLEDLVTLLRHGGAGVESLNERIQDLLIEANSLADKEEEKGLVDRLEKSFAGYARDWQDHRGP